MCNERIRTTYHDHDRKIITTPSQPPLLAGNWATEPVLVQAEREAVRDWVLFYFIFNACSPIYGRSAGLAAILPREGLIPPWPASQDGMGGRDQSISDGAMEAPNYGHATCLLCACLLASKHLSFFVYVLF